MRGGLIFLIESKKYSDFTLRNTSVKVFYDGNYSPNSAVFCIKINCFSSQNIPVTI